MKIQILNVSVTTKPTQRGSYQEADIAFKNLTFAGKVEGKKVMSFGATAETFKTLSIAQPGDVFDINVVKNDKGYNDWVSASKGVDVSPTTPLEIGTINKQAQGSANRVSTYETSEERAKKQIYIIRQSSIASAINLLSANSKTALDINKVLEAAESLSDYVLNGKNTGRADINNVSSFASMEDLIEDLPQ